MISRRLALFRIASASAAATVASATTAALLPPRSAETAALLHCGARLDRWLPACRASVLAKAEATVRYKASQPAIPEAMISTKETRTFISDEREIDWFGNGIWPSDPHAPPRRIHYAHNAKQALERFDGIPDDDLTDELREEKEHCQYILEVAERYHEQDNAAAAASDISQASERWFRTCHVLQRLLLRMTKLPALTPEGITIKARAYQAFVECCDPDSHRWMAGVIGASLCEDISRVLTEGEEA